MASGILGQSAPAATTNTVVYTVPAGKLATLNVNMVNTGGSPVAVRLAVSATSTPAMSEYVEYDVILPSNGVLERGGLVANATKNLVVYTTAATLSVSVFGYEE